MRVLSTAVLCSLQEMALNLWELTAQRVCGEGAAGTQQAPRTELTVTAELPNGLMPCVLSPPQAPTIPSPGAGQWLPRKERLPFDPTREEAAGLASGAACCAAHSEQLQGPGPCGSVGWALLHAPKCGQFDSWSGHKPRLLAPPLEGGMQEAGG